MQNVVFFSRVIWYLNHTVSQVQKRRHNFLDIRHSLTLQLYPRTEQHWGIEALLQRETLEFHIVQLYFKKWKFIRLLFTSRPHHAILTSRTLPWRILHISIIRNSYFFFQWKRISLLHFELITEFEWSFYSHPTQSRLAGIKSQAKARVREKRRRWLLNSTAGEMHWLRCCCCRLAYQYAICNLWIFLYLNSEASSLDDIGAQLYFLNTQLQRSAIATHNHVEIGPKSESVHRAQASSNVVTASKERERHSSRLWAHVTETKTTTAPTQESFKLVITEENSPLLSYIISWFLSGSLRNEEKKAKAKRYEEKKRDTKLFNEFCGVEFYTHFETLVSLGFSHLSLASSNISTRCLGE